MIAVNKIAVTVDASGDAEAYSDYPISGAIYEIEYNKTDFADGVDFTITGETTGVGVWTESNVNAAKSTRPTIVVQDQVGADTSQRDFVRLKNERLKIVVASGGNATSGEFLVYHEDS